MQTIEELLKNYKDRTLLAVFPHGDDFAFVAGGLAQRFKHYGIKLKLIVLTDSDSQVEIKKSLETLGFSDFMQFVFKRDRLKYNDTGWLDLVNQEVKKQKPFAILTFDPYGVTGNKDHIVCSLSVLTYLKSKKDQNILLLWRMADKTEAQVFNSPKSELKPNYFLNLKLSESITKIKAIFAFKRRLSSFLYRLKIIDFYLFDHTEMYYKVDLKKDKLVFKAF